MQSQRRFLTGRRRPLLGWTLVAGLVTVLLQCSSTLALTAADLGFRKDRLASPTVLQGSYFETHMQQHLGVTEHGELQRRLHEAAVKAQAAAEEVARSGTGTSEYLKWRLAREEGGSTEGRGRMLEVLAGSSGTASLSPPPLNSPPGTADVNYTLIRHGSVNAPACVDWRASPTVNTPVFDQGACESCWLWAASDIISMKWSMLSHFLTPVPVSPQHVCDCGFKKCCEGGWPEWTFTFAKLNKGVAPLTAYPYLARDNQKCATVNSSLLTGKITGWEKLPAANPVALIKTVSMHPVVVLLQASPSFLRYSGGIWTGSDCSSKPTVNHAVVVMGYNVTSNPPYWIAKNSWGNGWGEGGYVRIQILSKICGFGSEPSLYPTMFHVKTPCDEVPPPCGNGTCYLQPDGSARCQCPAGFVEKLEDTAPKCVTATPCNGAVNPCAFGTCVNEFDGSYTCWCPPGTVIGSRADGAETCIVNSVQSGLVTTTTVAGDNCTELAITYNTTLAALLKMNPFLNCSASLLSGMVLVVGGAESTGVGCSQSDVVEPGDSCSNIAQRNNITVAMLQAVNPSINCSALLLSQHVCVSPGQFSISSQYERSCGESYLTDLDDSCLSVASTYNISLVVLEWLNPGLDCTAPSLPVTSICVTPLLLRWVGITCNAYYNVTHGDTCFTVASAAGMDLDTFLGLNPGVRCLWPNWVVGMTLCINGTSTSSDQLESPPNLIPNYVKTNDTLASLSAQWAPKCSALDGTPATNASMKSDICWANGWYPNCNDRSLVVGSMVLIPCAQNIGATGCAAPQGSAGVSAAQWFVCGSDGVTYTSESCAYLAFTAPYYPPGYTSGGCPGCNMYCAGIAGLTVRDYYGVPTKYKSTTCDDTFCPFPQVPSASIASQHCNAAADTQVCQYARLLCANTLWGLSISQGCPLFKGCYSSNVASLNAGGCTNTQTLCGGKQNYMAACGSSY